MKKILVPTDFSKPAQIAVDVAADIAKKANAEILLLHVVEEASESAIKITGEVSAAGGWENKLFTIKLLERSKSQLDKVSEALRSAGVKVKQELRVGTAFRGMRDIITSQKVDLVVMGTAGRTKLEGMMLGSNTERVVRHSKCPVLTLHKKPATTDFKDIVYATSMSPDEEVFSRMVRETQKMYNSTIHLVRINTPGNFQRDTVVKQSLQAFAKKLQLKNFTINIFNDVSEEEGIIYFADSIGADLIAMTTHGRTGFAHVIAGSIAEDVVSHAKRPVLTFVMKRK